MTTQKIQISQPETGEEEWLATKESILSGWLTQGPKVAEFEQQFAQIHQVEHGIATTSCTTGLHLILAALGITEGDEVIIPAFTWVATANVVRYCGATPIFVDVDPKTFNMDPSQVASRLSNKTKAVIVVHLFGLVADVDAIKAVLPPEVKIIEDAACAIGATYKNKYAGGLGDAAAFSFHPRKMVTTGEGGMVTCNSTELAQKMVKLRNHGAELSEEQRHCGPKPYLLPEFNVLGFNYRMTDLQASIGIVQLNKLEKFLQERRHWANFYQQHLSDIDWIQVPASNEDSQHSWQAFVLLIDPEKAPKPRNQIMEELEQKGISTRPGTHAVHMLNYYKEHFQFEEQDYPCAALCNNNTMAIPLHNKMGEADYKRVVESLLSVEN